MAKKKTRRRTTSSKTKRSTRAAASRAPRKRTRRAAPAAAAGASIQCWLTDPLAALPPLRVTAPDLPGAVLSTKIVDPPAAPPPRIYATGTGEFRFWSAAEALRRSAAFWQSAGAMAWNVEIGRSLPVRLDAGVDLNAYYARNAVARQNIKQGLTFFHDTVREAATGRQLTVFSGESPDVVAHELGHAILDAFKPALWGLALTEAAAFHESFGDVSAILTALQMPEVRQAALEETGGRLARNSLVSRIAEQLGFAIRQRQRDAVDPDSLRNASNAFRYVDPLTLPISGPATQLTQRPHNFSRVFTGAFLEALGAMIAVLARTPRETDVQQASADMGRLLTRAILQAPVRTRFFQAVAEQIVLADASLFNGKYAEAVSAAFVRRGLLPVRSFAAPQAAAARSPKEAAAEAARAAAVAGGGTDASGAANESAQEAVKVPIDGAALGLPVPRLYVEFPATDDSVALSPSIAPTAGRDTIVGDRYSAVLAFLEGLVARGRVAAAKDLAAHALLIKGPAARRVTHRLTRVSDGVELERLIFECGC